MSMNHNYFDLSIIIIIIINIDCFFILGIVVTSLLPDREISTTSPAVIGILAAGFIIIIAIILVVSIILSYCCYQKIKKNRRGQTNYF